MFKQKIGWYKLSVRKIIIDCDPGIDDAVALLYAFKDPKIKVELITLVSGNVSVEKTTTNAIGICKLANVDIEIVKGSNRPLVNEPIFAEDVHGISGLGSFAFSETDLSAFENDDVVSSLYKTIMASQKKITLVAIGPFTNIAKLFLLYPQVKEKIEVISIMGGGIKGGNLSVAGEFNVLVDPEAAFVLFNSGVPIIMAGLDVTEKALLYPHQLNEIATFGEVGKFIEEIILKGPRPIIEGSLLQLNDVISIMALSNPEIFISKDMFVDIELGGHFTRGYTFADQKRVNSQKPNTKVLLDLDYDKFIQLLVEGLKHYA